MNRPRSLIVAATAASLALLAAPPAGAQDMQTRWTALPPIDSLVSPAISDHPDAADGDLYVAATVFNGLVAVSHTNTPGGWTAWEVLGPPPCLPQPCFDQAFYADANTQLQFVKHGNTLYLFARGNDDDLHFIRKVGTGAWDADWQEIPTGGRVRGRISVAVTQPAGGGNPEFAALYAAPNTSAEIRQFDASGNLLGVPWQWINIIEGTLGTDGENQLVAVLRTASRWLQVETKIRPWTTGWQPLATIYAEGPLGAFHDISNVVFFADAYHVAYSYHYLCGDIGPTYCDAVAVAAIPLNATTIRAGEVAGYTPSGGLHPRSTLAVYRNKVVIGTTGVDGWVRYARWDSADPFTPWVGDTIVSTASQASGRPALAAQDHRAYSTYPHAVPSFGNDLFGAIIDPSSEVQFINLSRAALMLEMDQQLTLWNSNERTDGPVCQHDPADATIIPDPFTDGRLVMSEIGFDLWALPDWLSSHFPSDTAEQACLAMNSSGRFPPPCSTTRYPVIIRPGGGIGICDGVWVNQGNVYSGVWEEFGHTLATGTLGFLDNGPPPDAGNAALSGIALADLLDGYYLFGEAVDPFMSCTYGSDPAGPNAGRCRGFTGEGGNYDVGTRQHSLIYPALYYFDDGDTLRDWVDRDLGAGFNLLERKYEWIRDHIFHGVEFRGPNVPLDLWNVDCIPTVPLTCGSTYTSTTAGRPDDVESYSCNAYAYTGPEVGHVLLAPEDALVEVTLSGLSADLDLLLTNNGVTPGCDTFNCAQGSTNGGTSSEFLQFNAIAGTPYFLMVDGYNGAASAYTITVSCTGASPGDVPQGNSQLDVSRNADGVSVDLTWGASCAAAGAAWTDYEVYEGTIGNWYDHEAVSCTTFGGTFTTVTPQAGNRYFLVVPSNRLSEGSYGRDGSGLERPQGANACLPLVAPSVCP